MGGSLRKGVDRYRIAKSLEFDRREEADRS
jgi:hypothetical protein